MTRRLAVVACLAAASAGCGHAAGKRLTITETTGVGRTLQHRSFDLDCEPPGGLPLARAVCAAIRAHPRAMLHPPPPRSACAGRVEGPTLVVRGSSVAIEGEPACGWPGGTALLLYEAAIRGDRHLLRVAASRLRCDEDRHLLARPTPWRSVFACTHDLWTPRSERLIAVAKRALRAGGPFPDDVGVLPCAGVARCGVALSGRWSGAPTVSFVEAWERQRHVWRVRVTEGTAKVVAESGPEPPRGLGWVSSAERLVLERFVGDARLLRVHYLLYPRKVAVVFEFDRPARCLVCSRPVAVRTPTMRALRVGFDRRTHRPNGTYRLCEVRGDFPPLGACLAR